MGTMLFWWIHLWFVYIYTGKCGTSARNPLSSVGLGLRVIVKIFQNLLEKTEREILKKYHLFFDMPKKAYGGTTISLDDGNSKLNYITVMDSKPVSVLFTEYGDEPKVEMKDGMENLNSKFYSLKHFLSTTRTWAKSISMINIAMHPCRQFAVKSGHGVSSWDSFKLLYPTLLLFRTSCIQMRERVQRIL